MKHRTLSLFILIAILLASIIPSMAQNTPDCEDGFRLFEHEYLGSEPVCVPESPERIAVLDLSVLEFLFIQGIEPVAMFEYGRDLIARSNPDINIDLMALTENTANVGNGAEVNLEVLLESNPDLIVITEYIASTAGLDTFSAIAPTVVFASPFDVGEYRSSVDFMSNLLNMPEVGDEILAQLDERLEAFQTEISNADNVPEISLTRLRDSIILFIGGSFGDHLIHEAGLIRPESQQVYDIEYVENENNGWVGIEVSEESLPLVDGEYLFVWTASPNAEVEEEARQLIATLEEDPLWNTLEALQNDHLFIVGSHWQGFGILEAHTALDDLFNNIVGVDPQEIAPNPFISDEIEEASSATFPITVTHSLGTIEVSSQPERVLALSLADTDMAYAFGFTPLAIYENPFDEQGLWPWLKDQFAPETALLPRENISLEYVVELDPDIILAGGYYNIAELYESLSDIAPTTAWQDESFNDTWQEQTLLAGQALGMEDKAQELIAETESQIAAVSEDYPKLVGKTFSLSYLHDTSTLGTIYRDEDFAVQFFKELGFELTPALAELAIEEGSFQGSLSLETLDLIEADLVILAFGSPEIQEAYESNPLYQQLPAVQDGRVVVLELATISQLRSPSVLGIRWVLEQLRPSFAEFVAH